jgi:hypothetical protein
MRKWNGLKRDNTRPPPYQQSNQLKEGFAILWMTQTKAAQRLEYMP